MITMFRSLLPLALAPILLIPAHAGLTPQEAADLAVKYSKAQAANINTLKSYSSNYRIELWEKDQLQWIDLVNVTVGDNSLPLLTQVNHDAITERKGLFRKTRQKRATKKQDEIVGYALRWILFYSRLPADRIHTLFLKAGQNAGVTKSAQSPNVIGVYAANVRDSDANDIVNLWLNKQNGHPIRFSFTIPVEKTMEGYEGATINATINYRYLKNGKAFYTDHIDVTIPSKKIFIKLENLNIQKRTE
jgi:hypothetical protein